MPSKWSIIAGFVRNEMKEVHTDKFGDNGQKEKVGISEYIMEAKIQQDKKREDLNRVYNQERHVKQERDELEREKVRKTIREKYGIAKKAESYVDL